ncbi:hypothetical protein, unlikely [Trypanosoma brucei gambiense DAL972]|uniref:Uncharacterized protein n=1 Tax=Trypanosoma brucei gambiense (strain MHOM/CI/86/DAL972) TaxID=679716 RepID=C9ZPI1_TRYB9|nr:hypothetical protein, unlikely [Trypanosoma brucei gambiense DAL972]CBH11309.1 hypothetical protein, unlikely [Trypanosoma brucei gambiense DAL972]|eukprot:XP_011773596.1 hypothetical protein, unlikely [Trypanosoma brucei gambiense DAL972]
MVCDIFFFGLISLISTSSYVSLSLCVCVCVCMSVPLCLFCLLVIDLVVLLLLLLLPFFQQKKKEIKFAFSPTSSCLSTTRRSHIRIVINLCRTAEIIRIKKGRKEEKKNVTSSWVHF